MTNEPDDNAEPFDAVAAAAELEEALAAPDEPRAPDASDGYIRVLELEVEELTRVAAEKDALVAAADERASLALGEVEQSKTRLRAEADKQVERRARKVIVAFVEVLDDLDRALASAKEMDHNPKVIEGVELVRRSFLKTLGELGVIEQHAEGEPFDPVVHEGATAIVVDDPAQQGKVVAVVRTGYLMKGKVLRPAGVVVGKAPG